MRYIMNIANNEKRLIQSRTNKTCDYFNVSSNRTRGIGIYSTFKY